MRRRERPCLLLCERTLHSQSIDARQSFLAVLYNSVFSMQFGLVPRQPLSTCKARVFIKDDAIDLTIFFARLTES
jgi:hypothetical protein